MAACVSWGRGHGGASECTPSSGFTGWARGFKPRCRRMYSADSGSRSHEKGVLEGGADTVERTPGGDYTLHGQGRMFTAYVRPRRDDRSRRRQTVQGILILGRSCAPSLWRGSPTSATAEVRVAGQRGVREPRMIRWGEGDASFVVVGTWGRFKISAGSMSCTCSGFDYTPALEDFHARGHGLPQSGDPGRCATSTGHAWGPGWYVIILDCFCPDC